MPKIFTFLMIFMFSFALLPVEAQQDEAEADKAAEETASGTADEEKTEETASSENSTAEAGQIGKSTRLNSSHHQVSRMPSSA